MNFQTKCEEYPRLFHFNIDLIGSRTIVPRKIAPQL